MSIKTIGVNNDKLHLEHFKSKFTKYSPFGLEYKNITLTNVYNYGQEISIDLTNNGDVLHKCFYQTELPILNFTDNIIKNTKYTTYKTNKLSNITIKINEWTELYNNFYNYSTIMIIVYKEVTNILELDNLTLDFLKNKVLSINDTYSDDLNTYKLLIDATIINYIDISSYVLNLTTINDLDQIKSDILKMYNNINSYLNYYHSNINYYQNKYNTINGGKVDYYWNDNLGHFLFTDHELNIDGRIFDTYSSDCLHINKTQETNIDYIDNYNKLIGNNDKIYENNGYSNYIYTPLLFWFCKDISKSLPLRALNNSKIYINSKISEIKDIIYFQNWEKMFNDLLIVDVPREDHTINDENNTIEPINLDYDSVEILLPENVYRYKCSKITKELLDLQFNGIDSNGILNYYGSIDSNGVKYMNLDDYIYLMNNIKTETNLNENTKIEIAGYHYFIDYNYLLSLIPKPKISLIGEFGYIDDVEKEIMVKNELKYLVEIHNEIIIDIDNNSIYDSLNEINGLVKEIFYFSQKKLNKNKISKYGKSEHTNYVNNYIDSIELKISNEYDIFEFNNNYPYNYLEAELPTGVSYVPFTLYPNESEQPSGCINMNDIKGQNLIVLLNDDTYDSYYSSKNNPNNLGSTIKIIYVKYNQFIIKNGKGYLTYY